MAELLETSSYFGLTLTLAIFWISHIGCRKLKISILNPILISSAIIIIILLCLDISYDTYEAGADLISKLLTPATICYAVPLYRQIEILKKRFVTIMISVACGSIASVLCVFGFSKLFHYSAGDLYSTASEISDYSYRHGCFRRTGRHCSDYCRRDYCYRTVRQRHCCGYLPPV